MLLSGFSQISRKHWATWLRWMLIMTAGYYLLLFAALLYRFGHWPNYINVYDWPANLVLIWKSTASWADRWMLWRQEWLVEIGYMNYDYGMGISEWSLVVIPWKLLGTLWTSGLLAALLVLQQSVRKSSGSVGFARLGRLLGFTGAASAGVSLVSLYWVVCCATPTWVVGLAMLGLDAATALWLQPLGGWLFVIGSLLQCVAIAAVIPSRVPVSRGPIWAANPSGIHGPPLREGDGHGTRFF